MSAWRLASCTGCCGREDQVVEAGAEDQDAVDRQQGADEEPDRNFMLIDP